MKKTTILILGELSNSLANYESKNITKSLIAKSKVNSIFFKKYEKSKIMKTKHLASVKVNVFLQNLSHSILTTFISLLLYF